MAQLWARSRPRGLGEGLVAVLPAFVTSNVCPSQALTRTCCGLTSGQRAPRGRL